MSREHIIEKIVSVLQDNGYTVLQESKTMKIYSGKGGLDLTLTVFRRGISPKQMRKNMSKES